MAELGAERPGADAARRRIADCHAVILCGGAGRRMGRRKEMLVIGGEPLLLRLCRSLMEVTDDVTVVADRERGYDFLPDNVSVATDRTADFGPVAGICAGMAASRRRLQLIVACDYPLADATLWRALADTLERHPEADAVLPEAEGKLHPLCALYRRETLAVWEAALAAGNRRVMAAADALTIVRWQPAADESYLLLNMNTPEDYRQAKERLGE